MLCSLKKKIGLEILNSKKKYTGQKENSILHGLQYIISNAIFLPIWPFKLHNNAVNHSWLVGRELKDGDSLIKRDSCLIDHDTYPAIN